MTLLRWMTAGEREREGRRGGGRGRERASYRHDSHESFSIHAEHVSFLAVEEKRKNRTHTPGETVRHPVSNICRLLELSQVTLVTLLFVANEIAGDGWR